MPGPPDQPGGADGSGSADKPRPFFADQPERSDQPGQSDQPGPAYGWPPAQPQDDSGPPGDRPPGWPPGNQPQQRPAPPRPAAQRTARPPERELRQRAIASLAFGVIALVALLGLGTNLHKGVYVLIFSAAVGIAAVVIGISALVKARKTGSYRPRFAVGGIILGALATLISVPILATYLAFPTQVDNYVNCLRQAQNSSDQRACMTKFYRSIHLGAGPGGRPPRPPGGALPPGRPVTGGTTGLAGLSGFPAQPPTDR